MKILIGIWLAVIIGFHLVSFLATYILAPFMGYEILTFSDLLLAMADLNDLIMLITWIIIGAILYFILKERKHIIKKEKQGFLPDSWKMIVIGFGSYYLAHIVIYSLTTYILGLGLDYRDFISDKDGYAFLTDFLATVIAAPIGEEYLFRGLVFNELKEVFTLKSSIILSALIFSSAHFLNLYQLPFTFFLGMVLAFIYYYRRNITDSIIVHMVNNLVADIGSINQTLFLLTMVVGFICFFVGIKFLGDIRKVSHETKIKE